MYNEWVEVELLKGSGVFEGFGCVFISLCYRVSDLDLKKHHYLDKNTTDKNQKVVIFKEFDHTIQKMRP